MYPPDAVYAVTFLANKYDIEATGTQVDIVLDTGAVYSVTLHCNGEFGADTYNAQDDHNTSSVEDLVGAAQRYDDEYGYGCSGAHR
jgi:hypothetical protein